MRSNAKEKERKKERERGDPWHRRNGLVGGFAEIAFNRCRTRVLHLAHLAYRVYSKRRGSPSTPVDPVAAKTGLQNGRRWTEERKREGGGKGWYNKRRNECGIKIR